MHCLYHESMKIIMEPLIAAGKEGIELTNARGEVVIGHPILACCVADYPEQCLMSGAKYNSCAKCYIGKAQLGDPPAKMAPAGSNHDQQPLQEQVTLLQFTTQGSLFPCKLVPTT